MKDLPAELVAIDTANYYPFRDRAIAGVDGGKPESVWVSEQIGRPVVKAWNAALAVTLAGRGNCAGHPDVSPFLSRVTIRGPRPLR